MTSMTRTLSFTAIAVIAMLVHPRISRAQHAEVETETARPLGNGNVEFGAAYEFQASGIGLEHALPLSAEVGIGDRFEFLVEPVAVTAIRPSAAERAMGTPKATGIGDLETTLFALVLHERAYTPAVSLAFEAKLPTARNNQIGTGKPDYAGYFIASKLVGKVDLHLNLSYTVVGVPNGLMAADVKNLFGFAVCAIVPLSKTVEGFAEVYGNTSASATGETGDAGGVILTPELANGEVVGSMGAGWYINDTMMVSLGASYDSNHAFQVRPGVTYKAKAF